MRGRMMVVMVGCALVMSGCFGSLPQKKEGAAPLRTGERVAKEAASASRTKQDAGLVKYASSEAPENAPPKPKPKPKPKPVIPVPAPVAPSAPGPSVTPSTGEDTPSEDGAKPELEP